MPTRRLFTAVMPPREVIEELAAQIVRDDRPTRWTPADQWHVTLLFTPLVDGADHDRLVLGLSEVAAGIAPFRLGVRGGGAFPDMRRAKHFVALLDDPSASLPQLNAGARATADALRITHGGGRYQPHLTLARINKPVDRSDDAGWLESLTTRTWTVDEVALVESNLDEPGSTARHRVVERFPLRR